MQIRVYLHNDSSQMCINMSNCNRLNNIVQTLCILCVWVVSALEKCKQCQWYSCFSFSNAISHTCKYIYELFWIIYSIQNDTFDVFFLWISISFIAAHIGESTRCILCTLILILILLYHFFLSFLQHFTSTYVRKYILFLNFIADSFLTAFCAFKSLFYLIHFFLLQIYWIRNTKKKWCKKIKEKYKCIPKQQ